MWISGSHLSKPTDCLGVLILFGLIRSSHPRNRSRRKSRVACELFCNNLPPLMTIYIAARKVDKASAANSLCSACYEVFSHEYLW